MGDAVRGGFEYVSVADAIARRGLRMVVVGSVPSPWGEAAKGILHVKRIPWAAVRLVYDDKALENWAGQLTGPVALYDDEPPRSGWMEILMLAERLAPAPALLPSDPHERARAVLLAEKFCGPQRLGWMRRLQMVHAGLEGRGGISGRVAKYLGAKYGYTPQLGAQAGQVVRALLGELGAELRSQRARGPYYFGATLTAVDIYSAAFMGMFAPLPDAHCAMHPASRAAFESLDDETRRALDPALLEHRDLMYARHLELPLSL